MYFCHISITIFVIICCYMLLEFTYSPAIRFSSTQVGGTTVQFCEGQSIAINDYHKL